MALIVEDGTGANPLANSYNTVVALRAYADSRGVELKALSNAELEQLMIKAMDFLEAQRKKYKGERVSVLQPLEWPRSDVWDVEKPGTVLASDQIPRLVEYAQLALAIEAVELDLLPNANTTGQGAITKEKVGNIEVTYSSVDVKQSFTSALSKPKALLSPLFKSGGFRLVKT